MDRKIKINQPTPNNETGQPLPYVNVELPFTYTFHGNSTASEKKTEVINFLGLEATIVFEMIEEMAIDLMMFDVARPDLAGCRLATLARLGKGLQDAQIQLTEFFDTSEDIIGISEKAEPTQPTVLDLSDQPTAENECIDLAKNLSAALNNPHIPNSLKTVIANGLSDLTVDDSELINIMDSPEYIAKVLCQQGGNND